MRYVCVCIYICIYIYVYIYNLYTLGRPVRPVPVEIARQCENEENFKNQWFQRIWKMQKVTKIYGFFKLSTFGKRKK